jgi:type IV pilus assembly protein PilW
MSRMLPNGHRHSAAARGFSLIELMIAITISVFLIGGLLTLVQGMKRATGTQNGLSQLQDNERFATDILSDVIQATGDYPNPSVSGLSGAFAALTVVAVAQAQNMVFAQGQTVTGVDTGTPAGSLIAVRYATGGTAAPPPTDGLISCAGNTSATPVTFVNVFGIDANGNLQCQLTTIDAANNKTTTTTTTLVAGVTNLKILYGVQTYGKYLSADAYLTAAQVTALALPSPAPPGSVNGWSLVKSVQLWLTVKNPLSGQPGQPASMQLLRMINVMNQVGEGQS